MRFARVLTIACLVISGTVLADWEPNDPHKMHFPQLPDKDGWDVRNTYYVSAADDFVCGQSGLITDFHIWYSIYEDDPNFDFVNDVEFIHTAIYADDPVVIETVSIPNDRIAKEVFYIPALVVLALIILMQFRRRRAAEPEPEPAAAS